MLIREIDGKSGCNVGATWVERAGRVLLDCESRLRAGTGHGLADIWRLRTRQLERFPDAVIRPETEEEVQAPQKALWLQRHFSFHVVSITVVFP